MTNQSLFNFAEKPQPLDTSADWISWERAMIDVLKVQGYSDLLKGQRNAVWEDPEELSPYQLHREKESWATRQEAACALIGTCCGPAARDVLAKSSSIEVAVYLSLLCKNYQQKGTAEAAFLYDDLMDNHRLDKCKSIADFADQLSRARDSIHSFNSHWNLPDALLISRFMKGLGPSYKSWKSTFWLQNSLVTTKDKDGSEIDGITFREVVKLAQKEEMLQGQNETEEAHALSAHRLSAHSRRPFCNHCKKQGHHSSICFVKYPEKKLARNGRKAKRNVSKTKQTSNSSEPTPQQPLPDTSNQGLISWAPPTDIGIWCG
ncbi:hypothetical protein E4U58_000628, partial [Claviceps cyperi]